VYVCVRVRVCVCVCVCVCMYVYTLSIAAHILHSLNSRLVLRAVSRLLRRLPHHLLHRMLRQPPRSNRWSCLRRRTCFHSLTTHAHTLQLSRTHTTVRSRRDCLRVTDTKAHAARQVSWCVRVCGGRLGGGGQMSW